MKVAVLSELFPPYLAGGGERRYYEICRRLAKKHEIHVYTMQIAGHKKEEIIDGIHVHRLGAQHPLDRRKYLPLLSYFFHLLWELRKEEFDLIDANAYISAIGGYLAARRKKVPIVATIHDVYGPKWGHYVGGLGWLGNIIEQVLLRMKFDSVITVSSASKGLLEQYGCRSEIITIPNGVSIEDFKPAASHDINSFIYVGRLVRLKNLDDLVRAIEIVKKDLPDAKLQVVGGGPEGESMRKLAREMDVESAVSFTGFLDNRREVARQIGKAGVFVNPSLREGFGIALLEAMAAGAAVVAYDLDAYREFAKGGENCLLAPPGDFYKLAECMKMATDSSVWRKLTSGGRKTAQEFTWDRTSAGVEEVWEGLKSRGK